MKKLLGILVLGLLWCNVGFALTQQSAINQYLSDRKLNNIEGVWITHVGDILAIYKSGGGFNIVAVLKFFLICISPFNLLIAYKLSVACSIPKADK